MRVAIVMRGDSVTGGAERRFVRLFEHLRKHGEDIHLIVNSKLHKDLLDANFLEYIPAIGSTNVSVAFSGSIAEHNNKIHVYSDKQGARFVNLLSYNLWVIRAITVLKPNIVHLPLLQKSLLPFYFWLYLFRSIKVVNTVALSWFAYPTKIPFSLLQLAKLVWRRANALDSLYPGFLSCYGKRYHHKTHFTPCSFTDTDKFAPSYPKAKEIVFAGRLVQEKNPLLLIQALAELQREEQSLLAGWRVYILGQGPMKQAIKTEIGKAGLDYIISISHVACTSTFLRHSRIFVSLQKTENYPSQSLLEAMASGNAIIATDVGETRRLVDAKTGLLVHEDNPLSLAKALTELIINEGKCYQLGLAARERVLSHCSLTHFAGYLKGVWENA